ncbi:hypothetical protein MKW98_013363 [Papaver atlanticum]|uniref:Uncharacterized protein n=1 Tax=Papaver atlanticum TaxID=357466 RepID=A0AAD4STQ5_9MAGN|nr:hypothetical protein MKW98_013363 [Papaver atlanticum]
MQLIGANQTILTRDFLSYSKTYRIILLMRTKSGGMSGYVKHGNRQLDSLCRNLQKSSILCVEQLCLPGSIYLQGL